MGIQRSRVRRPSSPLAFSLRNKIKTVHVALFTRQLATMMKAEIPLVQSFDIVIQGLDHPRMSLLTRAIRAEIVADDSFAQSLRRYPRIFDAPYCNLVEVGESSGALGIMFDRLATFKEKAEALKSKIRKAMNYPIAIILVALATTGIMLVKIVPPLAETFSSFGAELPAFTLLVVSLSDWVIAYWWQVLPGAVLTFVLFKKALLRSKSLDSPTVRSFVSPSLAIFCALLAMRDSVGHFLPPMPQGSPWCMHSRLSLPQPQPQPQTVSTKRQPSKFDPMSLAVSPCPLPLAIPRFP